MLGKKSGLDSIRIKAEELGLDVPEERYAELLAAVKRLGTEKRGLVTDDGECRASRWGESAASRRRAADGEVAYDGSPSAAGCVGRTGSSRDAGPASSTLQSRARSDRRTRPGPRWRARPQLAIADAKTTISGDHAARLRGGSAGRGRLLVLPDAKAWRRRCVAAGRSRSA